MLTGSDIALALLVALLVCVVAHCCRGWATAGGCKPCQAGGKNMLQGSGGEGHGHSHDVHVHVEQPRPDHSPLLGLHSYPGWHRMLDEDLTWRNYSDLATGYYPAIRSPYWW